MGLEDYKGRLLSTGTKVFQTPTEERSQSDVMAEILEKAGDQPCADVDFDVVSGPTPEKIKVPRFRH